MARKRKGIRQERDDMDMTPMIDMIFLLIIFFILAGKITSDLRSEQITVPPTFTAEKIEIEDDWGHMVIDVFGQTQNQSGSTPPRNTIKVGKKVWTAKGMDDYSAYVRLRNLLNQTYAKADKYPDPNNTGMQLPKVVVEVRADGNAEYRLVQEIQQILSDTIDPETMKPRQITDPAAQLKPFVNLLFTTRQPGDTRE
ncbi:MAG: biopolymer transporter ExbD [Planctomycetota bacterium]